jgi:FkbM family methyltransferase
MNFSEYFSFRNGLDSGEQKLLVRCARGYRESGVAMDIGANVGMYTVGMAAVGFRVHAFEPVASTFERLDENVAASGVKYQVTLNCLAVGDRCGTARFNIQIGSPATNHLATQRNIDPKTSDSCEINCLVTTLDTYLVANGVDSLDILKIDVEGFEPAVLRGARDALRRGAIHVILLEVCPPLLKRAGESTTSLCGLLHEYGYRICRLAADGQCGEELGPDAMDQIVLANVLAVPR